MDARRPVLRPGTALFLMIGVAAVSWLLAAEAAAVALRQARAAWAVVVLVAPAGVPFAIDHPFPPGTAAMACLFAATWPRTRRPA